MKTKFPFPLCFIILHSSICLPVCAQSTAFTYQGRLDESSGPANGSYDFKFQLFDAASSGASQGGPVTNSAVTVSGGLFTVMLDFGNQFPGADRWLEIAARTNGAGAFGVLSPRQLLASTPYAITAGRITGPVAASQLVGTLASGNIASNSITSGMLAAGAVSASNIAPGAITAAQLAKPPQSGSLSSASLVEDFGATSFAVSFNPAFSNSPLVTLSLQSTDENGGELAALFVKSQSKTNFTGRLIRRCYPLTVDRSADVGMYASLAVVDGNPAISYYDAANGNLKYVRANDTFGNSWGAPRTFSSTSVAGTHTSLAVVSGNPAIAYYDDGDLTFVRANESSGSFGWGAPTAPGGFHTVGAGFASLAVVNGNPAISYASGYAGFLDLKYVRATNDTGTGWSAPVTVESTGSVGKYSSLAIVLGTPAIAYLDDANNTLKFVHALDPDGANWDLPITVDASGDVGGHISLAVVGGKAAISYYDTGSGALKFVRATDTGASVWGAPVVLDSSGNVGQFTSLKGINGVPAISYFDVERRALKYVRAKDSAGAAWENPVSVEVGNVGGYTSLAAVGLQPAIAYYDQSIGALKFIRQSGAMPYTINWIAIEP